MFRLKGAFITNEKGKVLDVQGGADAENRNILVWNRHGKINQQWDIIYADTWKGEPTKGQINKDFGIVVERDFYVKSHMGSGRFLDLVNNRDLVIKTRNGRKTQKWYFDQKTLTIKTRYNNYSWNIVSNGGSSKIQIYSTNSNWW
jgi:membrane carboxypeptidase/penicillin-binding protein PbpC